MIRKVFQAAHSFEGSVKVVYIPDYDMRWAQLMTSGADLWLNTPHRPFEASGTSGMKAALNGVPSLSILDGWWIEGCVEGSTGWAIGKEEDLPEDHGVEAASLYDKLEKVIVPLFYGRPERLRRSHALHHRPERFVLQYRAHDGPVSFQCVYRLHKSLARLDR